jgi:tetratricopeptide (TPR) repeat protein
LVCVSALVAIAASAWYASREPPPSVPAPPAEVAGAKAAGDLPAEGKAAVPARRATISLATTAVPVPAEVLQAEAEQIAAELLARYPDLPEALHVAALLHARLRKTEEAERLWKRCVELAPTSEQYRVNLAAIAMDRGNNELAVQSLWPTVASGTSSPDASHHLALALANLGQNEEAEQVLVKALERHPNSAAHWQVLGQSRLKLGKLPEAEADLRRALELGARSADLLFALGNACARNGKADEAAEFRKQFADLKGGEPLEAQVRYQVLSTAEARQTALAVMVEAATVHTRQKDSQEAERLLLRAVAIDPGNVAACRSLAEVYANEGLLAEQRVVCERLMQLDPANVQNYAMLAELADDLGEPAAAEAALKQLVSVHPDFAPAYTSLARYYVEQAKPSKARWYAQEALRRHETAQGYELLATTCRLLGDEKTAAAAMEKAKELASSKPWPGGTPEQPQGPTSVQQ